jgi:VanZ family protein
LWLWAPPIAEMAGLFWASSRSDLATLPGHISDKVAHFGAFGLLGVLVLRAWAGGRWAGVNRRSVLFTAAVGAAYGAFDELHQLFTPGRSSSIGDWLADVLGTLTAILLALTGAWLARRAAARRGV